MSQIVKATVSVAYRNRELLTKTLEKIGTILENEQIHISVGGGDYLLSRERYDIVLESLVENDKNVKFRLGFKEDNGLFVPFNDNWGQLGRWAQSVLEKTDDYYLAHHYAHELEEEGFESKIVNHEDGSLEVLAVENSW